MSYYSKNRGVCKVIYEEIVNCRSPLRAGEALLGHPAAGTAENPRCGG